MSSIDKSLSKDGRKLMVLMRLQPIIPWNILNYILAVTSCKLSDFAFGMYVGSLPSTLTFIYVGVNLANIKKIFTGERKVSPFELVLLVVQFSAVLLLVYFVGKESKRQLKLLLEGDS